MSTVNATALHIYIFERTMQREIAEAAEIDVERVHIVWSRGPDDSSARTLVRFEIHPSKDGSGTAVTKVIESLESQSSDPDSYLRSRGSFLRRVIDKKGALNIVPVKVSQPGASKSAASTTEAIDPFVDLSIVEPAAPSAAPNVTASGPAGTLSHGGIAGIVVAASFLGLGIIAGAVWYGIHRTKAGSRFKQARASSAKNPIKIQLTEAEKAEMGMHRNPAHAQAKAKAKVAEAVELAKRAVSQDTARNFREAIVLYENTVKLFMEAMKLERNPQYKFQLAKKSDKYLVRVRELKEYVGGRGGGEIKAAPVVRSPTLVRAPLAQ